MGKQKLAKGEPKDPLIIKAACTLRTALLLTSLAGFVLPTSSSRNKKLIPPAGWRKEPASSAYRRLMQTMFCLDYRKATQVTIVNGLIGHDPPGPWNWEGPWPGWNRATFRAGSFEKLAAFMTRIRKNSNVHSGFHLNITDVKIGLCDYPESRVFFKRAPRPDRARDLRNGAKSNFLPIHESPLRSPQKTPTAKVEQMKP